MGSDYTNGDPAEGVLRNTLTINRHFLANGYKVKGGGKIYHNFAAEGRDDTWSEWVGLFPTAGGNVHNLNGSIKSAGSEVRLANEVGADNQTFCSAMNI